LSDGPNKFLCHPNQCPFQLRHDDGELWVSSPTGFDITRTPDFIAASFYTDHFQDQDAFPAPCPGDELASPLPCKRATHAQIPHKPSGTSQDQASPTPSPGDELASPLPCKRATHVQIPHTPSGISQAQAPTNNKARAAEKSAPVSESDYNLDAFPAPCPGDEPKSPLPRKRAPHAQISHSTTGISQYQASTTPSPGDELASQLPCKRATHAQIPQMEASGFILDITAIVDQQPYQASTSATSNTQVNQNATANPAPQASPDPNSTTIPSHEQEWTRRLNISGNNSFMTKTSDAVSRANNATNTSDGAESLNPDPTASRRNYRESVLEQARLKARNAVHAANNNSSSGNDEDSLSTNSDTSSNSFSQGQPASNGSAASISKTTANSHRVSKDGGARA